MLRELKKQGKSVVFTNGCFDLLHLGHARYLAGAARQGDVLVVAINTDKSVRRLKGKDRPIFPEQERAEMLAGLESVDYVTFFNESTPLQIIKRLKPDVLVKGADWAMDDIVGRKETEALGGRVVRAKLTEGYSSTSIFEKIQALPK